MEEEQKPMEESPVDEQPAEEVAPEAPATEEAPAEEEAPVEEAAAPECAACGSECSEKTKSAEDLIRDLVNLINVYKGEEKEGTTTKIDPETADELVAKLEEVAKAVGGICE